MSFNKLTTLNLNDDFKSIIDNLSNMNVASANKLSTARTISLIGDIVGSATFDGTSNISITTVEKDSGVIAGTYSKVTVNSKGVITLGANVVASDVGLGNVTNESKTTMFTSPNFTGVPIAATAVAGTNTTQVATTSFVTTAVSNKTTITGNAGSATKLLTSRLINGIAFDGTADITITANPNSHIHDDRYYTESEIDTKLSILGSFVSGVTLPDVSLRNVNSLYFKITG